jgi:hypothetical protein
MASIIQELLRILSIQHNPSTAYHPQTDGQSECSNQKLEQYTRIFTNYYQTNWSDLLPLAQYTFNAWPNATTKKAPFKLIMGHIPCVHQPFRVTTSPTLNDRMSLITQARKDAADALRKSQALEVPSKFTPYCTGDQVWLEGRNLHTTHPSAKLVPRRYGPFLVTSAVTDLQGPPSERTQTEKLRDLKKLAQQYTRDLGSCDNVQISYLETLEERDNDNLRLAQMLAL